MDWRTIRAAVNAAYPQIGEQTPRSIPQREWDFASAVLKVFCEQSRRICPECEEPIEFRAEIVCLDCKAALHEGCAPRHFWPNGRPKIGEA